MPLGPIVPSTISTMSRFSAFSIARPLLDRREYQQWLALLTDDVIYRVFARVTREAQATSLDYAIIDEDATSLKMRVDQISNPRLTRAENPPAFTRRFVSNFEANFETPDQFAVEIEPAHFPQPHEHSERRALCWRAPRPAAADERGTASGAAPCPP